MIDRLTGVANSISKSSCNGPLGTLYLTPTHLIFVDKEGGNESWVLHSHLSSIEKQSVSSLGTPLQIRCKNFQSITFILPKEKDAHEVWTSLFNLSQPLAYQDLYCFRYSASNEPFKDQRAAGWSKFDLLSEFRRQGVPNRNWVITDLNQGYSLCETYPQHLLVPASATEQMIRASAGFRSKNRLPVLSYFYQKNGASICRCSQPLSGFNTRCEEDESMMNAILQTSSGSSRVLYIVDTRPIVSGLISSFLFSLPTAQSFQSLWPSNHRWQKVRSSSSSSSTTTPAKSSNELKRKASAFTTHRNRIFAASSSSSTSTSSTTSHNSLFPINPHVTASLMKMNAYANKAAGKGFENERHYENMKFNFFGIENIHVMRGSLNRLLEGMYGSFSRYSIIINDLIIIRFSPFSTPCYHTLYTHHMHMNSFRNV